MVQSGRRNTASVSDILVEMKPLDKNQKKEGKVVESEEKVRLRRFLREKDLKKHLKGKSSIEGVNGNNPDKLDGDSSNKLNEARIKGLQEDLRKDNQLQQAVALLSGWEIMRKTFKNLNVNTTDSLNRISLQ